MTGTDALRRNWIVRPSPQPDARLRLICLPYAGGGAAIYRAWPRYLPPTIEVCAVQLPGRELRINEPPYTDLRQLARDLVGIIEPLFAEPWALFGHSMGALIGFELARELRRQGRPGPTQLFVSGCRAPQLAETHAALHDLADPDFIAELKQLGGTPQEVLEHRELLELILPVLRADFALVETYSYPAEPALSCPITAFGGLSDQRVLRADLAPWQEQTSGAFLLRMLPGDHFFIRTMEALVVQYLRHDLAH